MDEKYNTEKTVWGILAMMVFATREEGKPTIKVEAFGSPRPASRNFWLVPLPATPMPSSIMQIKMEMKYLKPWVRTKNQG